jgi:hypothetical protein
MSRDGNGKSIRAGDSAGNGRVGYGRQTLFGPEPIDKVFSILVPAGVASLAFRCFYEGISDQGFSHETALLRAGVAALVVFVVGLVVAFMPSILDPLLDDDVELGNSPRLAP